MKIFMYLQLFSVCCLLFSCYTEDNPARRTYYSKCYFLGEKSFTFEGETFNDYTPPAGWPESEPFESVIVRLRSRSSTDLYEGWEISGTNISKNKFRIEIDTTANGITINKDIIMDYFVRPFTRFLFPDNFPAVELMFCFNGANYSYTEPTLKELIYLSKTEYIYYHCPYIFVAEPIDLSGKDIIEGNGVFGYYIDTYCYDLNFTKPGWYKIVADYNSEFGNDPKFSSTKNNYFRF